MSTRTKTFGQYNEMKLKWNVKYFEKDFVPTHIKLFFKNPKKTEVYYSLSSFFHVNRQLYPWKTMSLKSYPWKKPRH